MTQSSFNLLYIFCLVIHITWYIETVCYYDMHMPKKLLPIISFFLFVCGNKWTGISIKSKTRQMPSPICICTLNSKLLHIVTIYFLCSLFCTNNAHSASCQLQLPLSMQNLYFSFPCLQYIVLFFSISITF